MAVQFQSTFDVQQKFEKLTFNYESQISVDSGMASAPSTPLTPTSPVDFEVRMATDADKPRMIEFLRKFFFRDEPLNKYLGIVTELKPINTDLETFAGADLGDPSIVAELDGKLIGVSLNGILTKEAKEEDFVPTDKNFAKIFHLLTHVAEQSQPFQHFPDADKAMTIKIISVDDSYRGRGIAKHLMAKTKEIAIERGCGFMTVDCTSHFTAMALKRLGFEQIWGLNYADYKPDGEVVFEPEPPHKAVTVYVQKL